MKCSGTRLFSSPATVGGWQKQMGVCSLQCHPKLDKKSVSDLPKLGKSLFLFDRKTIAHLPDEAASWELSLFLPIGA